MAGAFGRSDLRTARRLVVKVGSSSLTGVEGGGLEVARLEALVGALAERQLSGTSIVLVSSGAIAAGIRPLGLRRRPRDLATQQAAASVGQGALVSAYQRAFSTHGLTVGQVLLTADDVTRRSHYTNARRTMDRLLELGVIPIVNENDTVATQEIRFGDNDRLAALVSHIVGADVLVLLTDVDSLYDGPPEEPGTSRVPVVVGNDGLTDIRIGGTGTAIGSGGMVTKVEAASIAGSAGIPSVLGAADQVRELLSGKDIGTLFVPAGSPRASRKLWLAHATSARGQLILDEGAVRAVVERRKSLLAAGVTGVTGTFSDGDAVDICGPDGVTIARGLVNYGSAELPGLLGRTTRDLAAALGPEYEREVVHRDDLVVL